MNSCGVNIPEILAEFVEINEIQNIIEEYYFSEWYHLIEQVVPTPKSIIFKYDDLFNGVIDAAIKQMKTQTCFARLDSCSAKPTTPYKSSAGIADSLKKSDRTRDEFKPNANIIIREWITLKDEFRCFVHNKKLRGITNAPKYINKYLFIIHQYVDKICMNASYDDYVVDFGFTNDGELLLIEINTPVYLCATSGDFDLAIPADKTILLGEYNPEIIPYPIIRYINQR